MVKGKKHLCSTFEIQKYFKAFQGIFEQDLNWYSKLEKSVIKNHIDEKYQHFLTQPVVERDTIKWYAKYDETAVRLIDLPKEQRAKYEQIKEDTINHYQNIVDELKRKEKEYEASYLENAIRYIDNRFIYCFKGKVVLGVWGMKFRDTINDPFESGEIAKTVFVSKQDTTEPKQDTTEPKQDTTKPKKPKPKPPRLYNVRFNPGENGSMDDENSEFKKYHGESIDQSEIPQITAKNGYDFNGWDDDPNNYTVTDDKTFTAQYERWPWYKQFWHWFKTKGWKWLLALLLLLLLFWLLFRSCTNHQSQVIRPIPSEIQDRPWVDTDPRSGEGGIYNPGNPYDQRPRTPPEYEDVLPRHEGVLPPIDSTEIVQRPDRPTIIGNRLNILMKNQEKDIKDLAKDFKEKYPEEKYKVVYYDNVVKRMQIEIPPREREKVSEEIPEKLPDYELFVFDESLFEGSYTPNDPAFKDTNKSWYLKAIDAPRAWDVTKGSDSITVAIVDNGFNLNHPELKSKVVMPYNVWSHSSKVFPQKIDHGTHVAGTALAIMDNEIGLCGIAPNAAFMPIQVANKQNITTTTSVLDGILYALYQGADVINLSMGMEFPGTFDREIQEELKNYFKPEERLWREVMEISENHNAIIVIAAGNNNMLADIDPINRPENFIVVSAVDKNEEQLEKASFSDFGQLSTVSAPGVDIYSTVGDRNYEVMSGTSMAAPIISGSIGLMKSLNNQLTAQEIVCAMQSTGKPTAGNVGNFLQLDKALKKVTSGDFENCEPTTPSPSSGDVQILLSWENYNDLDLFCEDPNGEIIWFKNKQVQSGGQLEIDMNIKPQSKLPIENIYWPEGKAPNGTYKIYVLYYKNHKGKSPLETPYKVNIKYGDKTEVYEGSLSQVKEKKHITTFTLGPPSNNNNQNDRVEQLKTRKQNLKNELKRIDEELEKIKIQT